MCRVPVSLSQTENQPKIQRPPSVHIRIIFMKDVKFCSMVNLHILIWLQQIKMFQSNDKRNILCNALCFTWVVYYKNDDLISNNSKCDDAMQCCLVQCFHAHAFSCAGDKLQLRWGRAWPEWVHQKSGLQCGNAISQSLHLHQQHPGVWLWTLRLQCHHPRSCWHFWRDAP